MPRPTTFPDQLSAYDFALPEELIAQEPSAQREEARLLVVRREPSGGLPRFEDLHVRELPDLCAREPALQKALWVRNRTRVFPARFYARRLRTAQGGAELGGRHEIVLLKELESGRWEALIRNSASLKYPQTLCGENDTPFRFLATGPNEVDFGGQPIRAWLEKHGEMPLPPYIKNRIPARDRERYQSTWAREDKSGSAAAPTASLHFTPELCERLLQQGARFADLILHVGLGTFAPLRENDLGQAQLHAESLEAEADSLATLNQALAQQRKVVAVGTTSLRCLESLPLGGQEASPLARLQKHPDGSLSGETCLFVRPGHEIRYASALFSNFHLPQSSLFVLVSVFAGSLTLAQEAYAHAVKRKYRFFSFGDASLWV